MPRTESTASQARPHVRPLDIARFGELVLAHVQATQTGRSRTPHCYAVRVATFLDRRLSGKTTADVTPDIIDEFTGMCGDLSENTRRDVLSKFRMICNLAVAWGYLERNPFDDRPLPKKPGGSRVRRVFRGRDLDIDQVNRILEYSDSSMDEWRWHRLHAIAAVFAHAGLTTGEALGLKVEDCDLDRGIIRVQRRAEKLRSQDDPIVDIPPLLVERLKAWLPHRLEGKRSKYRGACFGTILGDDGRTEIPDEAQRVAVAEMIRWRGQGWGTMRIANELTRLGIPTKSGNAKWHMASVQNILKREGKYYIDSLAAGSNGSGRAQRETKADPGYMFPSITGGKWAQSGDPGYSVTEQLAAVGKALGIEGLTSESMRRFYGENRGYILRLWGAVSPKPDATPTSAAGPTSAPPDSATGRDKSIDRKARPCPVELRGVGLPIRVYGVEVPRMTGIAYDLTAFAVERYLEGNFCAGVELAGRTSTTCSNPIKSLKLKLKEPGFEPLARVLIWDGMQGGRLRIIDPGPV